MRDEEFLLRLPRRKRKRSFFAMTPLADAMFQLLIFFMLSSNLTPYASLLLRSAQGAVLPDTGPGGGGGASAEIAPEDLQIWRVKSETVVLAGDAQERSFEDLPELAERLAELFELPRVILELDRTARVQSLATVLEVLNNAGIKAIQIAVPEEGRP